MSKQVKSQEPRDSLALFEKLVATVPGIERKGATMPYTSLNGHMFSLLTREDTLALSLPEPEPTGFLRKYKTVLVEQYGVVMKEYIAVPKALLTQTRALSKCFQISIKYVRGLKPKPTTRKRASAGAASTSSSSKGQSPKPRRQY